MEIFLYPEAIVTGNMYAREYCDMKSVFGHVSVFRKNKRAWKFTGGNFSS